VVAREAQLEEVVSRVGEVQRDGEARPVEEVAVGLVAEVADPS
jgi:hypothetical protein